MMLVILCDELSSMLQLKPSQTMNIGHLLCFVLDQMHISAFSLPIEDGI